MLTSLPHLLLLLSLFIKTDAHADNNNVAHALFLQGEFAQAAEVFTDPAWKGVALYRSEQWWRAAEAFVRANDSDSQFNLGNCYVKLGYYALALDAYQRALSMNPEHTDAEFNAELMRTLIARNQSDDHGQSALQSDREEIDQVDTEKEDSPSSSGGNEPDEHASKTTSDENDKADSKSTEEKPVSDKQDGGDTTQESDKQDDGSPGSSKVRGQNQNSSEENHASGGSESDGASPLAQATGLRTNLEKEQATEQWLNQIKHDPYRFLQRRIQLELQRRDAAGQRAPDGGSSW